MVGCADVALQPNTRFDEVSLEAALSGLRLDQDRMAEVLAERADKSDLSPASAYPEDPGRPVAAVLSSIERFKGKSPSDGFLYDFIREVSITVGEACVPDGH